jgi:glycine/D-amino acid oxidase-like deaminating enzyme
MNKRTEFVDTLVVGQGLAGSVLAWELLRRKQRVLVVNPGPGDDEASPGASHVSGGVINPMSGPRFTRPTDLEPLLSSALDFYGDIEENLLVSVFQEQTIRRIFNDELEAAKLAKRAATPAYEAYIGERLGPGELGHGLSDPLGSVSIRGARVDLPRLLLRLRQYLQDTDRLMETALNAEALTFRDGWAHWRHIRARQLVFCEGFRVRENPWFHWAPVRPSKGEVLTIDLDHALPDGIISKGKALIPLGAGRYRLGATYERDEVDTAPTAAAREALLAGLDNMFLEPPTVTVLAHQAGIRPGKTDHRPVLGRHPEQSQLAILNGLGSKGALLAPHYARLLADHLEKGTAIPESADAQYWHERRSEADTRSATIPDR